MFRRVDKFDGDFSKYRSWIFDLLAAIGLVDGMLALEIKKLLGRQAEEDPSKWEVDLDGLFPKHLEKYSSELYGMLCMLTSGEAKMVMRGISDSQERACGFKALLLLQKKVRQPDHGKPT